MLQLILKTFDVCVLVLAWIMLGLTLISIFWERKRNQNWLQTLVGKKGLFILFLCFIINLNIWELSSFCNILLESCSVLAAGYVFYRSLFCRVLLCKLGSCILPDVVCQHSQVVVNEPKAENEEKSIETIEENTKGDLGIIISNEKIDQIHRIVDSPVFLYNPDASLHKLAREVAVNVTYLSYYFNRKLGVSFPEYITIHRLDKAEELLRDTDLRIVEIFEQVGFQNSSTFYQAFNNRHQMTPLQWRKNMKGI